MGAPRPARRNPYHTGSRERAAALSPPPSPAPCVTGGASRHVAGVTHASRIVDTTPAQGGHSRRGGGGPQEGRRARSRAWRSAGREQGRAGSGEERGAAWAGRGQSGRRSQTRKMGLFFHVFGSLCPRPPIPGITPTPGAAVAVPKLWSPGTPASGTRGVAGATEPPHRTCPPFITARSVPVPRSGVSR